MDRGNHLERRNQQIEGLEFEIKSYCHRGTSSFRDGLIYFASGALLSMGVVLGSEDFLLPISTLLTLEGTMGILRGFNYLKRAKSQMINFKSLRVELNVEVNAVLNDIANDVNYPYSRRIAEEGVDGGYVKNCALMGALRRRVER